MDTAAAEAIVRDLAAADPGMTVPWGDEDTDTECVFCAQLLGLGGPEHTDHETDCVWRRAKLLIRAAGER
jgi:hypothetical protein